MKKTIHQLTLKSASLRWLQKKLFKNFTLIVKFLQISSGFYTIEAIAHSLTKNLTSIRGISYEKAEKEQGNTMMCFFCLLRNIYENILNVSCISRFKLKTVPILLSHIRSKLAVNKSRKNEISLIHKAWTIVPSSLGTRFWAERRINKTNVVTSKVLPAKQLQSGNIKTFTTTKTPAPSFLYFIDNSEMKINIYIIK